VQEERIAVTLAALDAMRNTTKIDRTKLVDIQARLKSYFVSCKKAQGLLARPYILWL